MAELVTPDICVIGAGSGGLSVAAAAAAFGVSVVLIEKGEMGGDCLNFGCVPSKALLAAARQAQTLRQGAAFGIADVEPTVDFAAVARHVEATIAEIAPNDSAARFTALGVQVIRAEACFVDRRTVAAGDRLIRARRFVIATGSAPRIPPIPGLAQVAFLTNETIFALRKRPAHLLVIGAGPVGLELAQAFRRLGSEVTVIEAARPLATADPEAAAVVTGALAREGVRLLAPATVVEARKQGRSGVRLLVETAGREHRLDGSHLLVAAGRRPNVEGLGLDVAGIAYDEKGIAVGNRLRTTNRRVYAVGDVAGGPQFTHVAGYHASLVVRALLFRLPIRVDPTIIPRVTFTDPELAEIGSSEAEAEARGILAHVLRWPFSENDRARTERRTEGHIKVLADRRGRILGASIVGSGAGEMIGLWGLAIGQRLTLKDMAGWLPAYPTTGEIGRRAAIAYFAPMTLKASVRRLVRLLSRFG